MGNDANDFLMSGGVRSAKFEKPKAKVGGVIARQPELQTQRDFKTGAVKTFDDGNPMKQIRVVLKTELHEDAEDNGERALYLKGNLLKAVQAAVRAAGAEGIAVGGKLTVQYIKDGEAQKGLNAPKLYKAKYEPPATPVGVSEAEDNDSEDEDEGDLEDF